MLKVHKSKSTEKKSGNYSIWKHITWLVLAYLPAPPLFFVAFVNSISDTVEITYYAEIHEKLNTNFQELNK